MCSSCGFIELATKMNTDNSLKGRIGQVELKEGCLRWEQWYFNTSENNLVERGIADVGNTGTVA
jgi:hypothetical protein